ncbi:MAG: ZIP family metal transporter, partial [Erysipelotrichaceae bacterium]|nr:ZIP family metal transporter [Erysipelotrichaceae bacterium]
MLILQNVHPLLQALLAGCFTWSITALGSLMVYFFRKPNQFLMDAMLGFAAGVMIAASCWSLLIPALELSYSQGMNSITIVSFGFLSGGLLLFVIDQLFSAYFKSTQDKRAFMLITSITLHNIPEG